MTQPPLDLLQAPALLSQPRALLSDLVEQPQHQLTRTLTAPKRDLLRVLSPQLHAP